MKYLSGKRYQSHSAELRWGPQGMRDKLSTPKMGESVSLVLLIAATTAASVTNAAVTWGAPPVNITTVGEDAGFSVEGSSTAPKYFFPEAHQEHPEDLKSVTKLTDIVRLHSQILERHFIQYQAKLQLGSTRSNFYFRGVLMNNVICSHNHNLQNILSHQAVWKQQL